MEVSAPHSEGTPPPPHMRPIDPKLHPPPSRAQVFAALTSAMSTPLSKNDPRVSLRGNWPNNSVTVDHLKALDGSGSPVITGEPCTLSAFRETEGSANRLTKFKRLFDTIPVAAPSPPPSPEVSTVALPELEREERQCEWDRRIYARELWRKCNGHETPAASAAMNLRPPEERQAVDRVEPAPLPTAADRWSAFERYAEEKEKELWRVFVDLDSDGDMRLRRSEVAEACRRAGIQVREAILDDFIRTVDKSGDGAISFEEWRDFLLLLPRPTTIAEIFRYYQTHRLRRPSMSRLNQDGDVAVGGGKTGWNKLLGKSAVAAKDKARAQAEVRDATNLHKAETVNDERQWAMAEAEKMGGQDVVSKAETRTVTPTRETETAPKASQPIATSSSSGAAIAPKPSTPVVTPPPIPADTPEEEEDSVEDEPTHGMFAGAGKFLLAGGLAGAVSRTATAPFDRLKVYLITSPSLPQAPPPPPSIGDPSLKVKKPRRNAGSIPAAIRAVWKQGGGPKAFWTGNGLNVIKIFPESAIKFLSYESAKRVFAQYWDEVPDQTMISNSSRFVAGGIGGVTSQFVIYPIETLKTRVMSSTGGAMEGNALIAKTAADMWRKGGIKLYFRGLPAGLIGVFPYSAIDMSTFEGIKLAYTKWAGQEPGIPGSLCFGAVSGGIGATSVYPLNLVRTRLQAQGTPAHPQTYTGVRDAAYKCFQREGWRGFYKGLTPTLVKVVPAVAISYAVYDASKKVLFGREEHCHTQHQDSDCEES